MGNFGLQFIVGHTVCSGHRGREKTEIPRRRNRRTTLEDASQAVWPDC